MQQHSPGPPRSVSLLLATRPVSHVRWGLDRTREMLDSVGCPENRFRSLHVAGTNGKGSVAASLASVLSAQGFRTGLYTSPHLIDFRERIQVAGGFVAGAVLERSAEALLPHADRTGATYFEAATALAFLCFAEEKVDFAVVETGLGGRLDATNVLDPVVSVITSLSLDHADYLGATLGEIAAEKAGILKRGVPAAVAAVSGSVGCIISEAAERAGAPTVFMGRDARVEDVGTGPEGTSFTYYSPAHPGGIASHTPLIGLYQAENSALARLALEQLPKPPAESAVAAGMAQVRVPGRFQLLEGAAGVWVLDIAHNEAAAAGLLETMSDVDLSRPWIGLVSILGDKPWKGILSVLASRLDGLVLTVAPSSPGERRWSLDEAAGAVSEADVTVCPGLGDSIRRARELAGDGTVVVTGSAYIVGDVLGRFHEEGDYICDYI